MNDKNRSGEIRVPAWVSIWYSSTSSCFPTCRSSKPDAGAVRKCWNAISVAARDKALPEAAGARWPVRTCQQVPGAASGTATTRGDARALCMDPIASVIR
ncbi:hypothetical protein KCP70_19630 [Salmonella enterica subsp. enterica]|nr:hypothetical protein KCP70_19630 [Salmonella enterica subsp. enterica]